jgi:hypothetical protein
VEKWGVGVQMGRKPAVREGVGGGGLDNSISGMGGQVPAEARVQMPGRVQSGLVQAHIHPEIYGAQRWQVEDLEIRVVYDLQCKHEEGVGRSSGRGWSATQRPLREGFETQRGTASNLLYASR